MIIHLNQRLFTRRYLPEKKREAFSLFFSGGCSAFRYSALKKIGFYDEKLNWCEDMDVGIRVGAVGKMFFNPDAKVVHTGFFSLRKVIDQWAKHAQWHIYLIKKFCGGGIEFVGANLRPEATGFHFRCVYFIPSRMICIVHLQAFGFMNLFTALTLLSPAGGLRVVFGFLTVASAAVYFRQDLRGPVDWPNRIRFSAIRFLINGILIYRSFWMGLRHRIIYLSFTR